MVQVLKIVLNANLQKNWLIKHASVPLAIMKTITTIANFVHQKYNIAIHAQLKILAQNVLAISK